MAVKKRQKQAKWLRRFRKIHRATGAALFIFFFFISITGLLLGWKKHSGGLILSKSYQGTSTDLADWLPLDSLQVLANTYLMDNVSPNLSTEIDRIDIRKDKGMVKFTYTDHIWGLQLDGTTGKLLHTEKRYSDLIERIHDGSILDQYLGTSNNPLKVLYTSIMGVALLIFTITGFWLWYGPKRMRRNN
ncbi:PepSY-associated TM region [Maribacter sedimenticola]|uniref:PepSY-associated TM region n=1 Tax=Maribacter sedimenticola TaxID=228956 RepID=A0ABY1SJB4_9FLAO|nr:PepSY domain-containing protein [Maribacter sedimenticola]SNR61139.1 PepSY-associated TM region [Maribacter sedimenticola]